MMTNVVQVDESCFSRKPKVCKSSILILISASSWTCTSQSSVVDISHTPTLGYVYVVYQRDAATLLPIIQQHTKPSTEVHSDQWVAYNMSSLPNVSTHRTVNPSQPPRARVAEECT